MYKIYIESKLSRVWRSQMLTIFLNFSFICFKPNKVTFKNYCRSVASSRKKISDERRKESSYLSDSGDLKLRDTLFIVTNRFMKQTVLRWYVKPVDINVYTIVKIFCRLSVFKFYNFWPQTNVLNNFG